jgi:hypothetical protein
MHHAILTPIVSKAALTLAASLLAMQGCTALKPADDHPGGAAHCAHRQLPPPPAVTGRGGSLDLKLAVWQQELGTGSEDDAGRPRYQDIGFDLDNTCTGEGQGPSCLEPPGVPPSHYHDYVDGIDNALGQASWKVLPDVITTDPDYPTLVIRVREYSGEPDDDQVEVSLYYALGLTPRDDGRPGPLWDGLDKWAIMPQSLEEPEAGTPSVDQPRFVDKHAYVSGYMLAARFDGALTASYLTVAPTRMWPIRHVMMAGSLRKGGDGTWELQNATTGARIAVNTLAQSAAWVPNGNGLPFCQFPSAYKNQVRTGCSFADIAYDGDSPSAPCDAVSIGTQFQAKEALLGKVAEQLPTALPSCNPSVIPEMESCASVGDD